MEDEIVQAPSVEHDDGVAFVLGAAVEADDEEGAFDAGFFPGGEGGVEDVDYGVGGYGCDGCYGGEVAAEDGEVEGGV